MIFMKTNSFQVNPLFPLFCGLAAAAILSYQMVVPNPDHPIHPVQTLNPRPDIRLWVK